MGSEQHIATKIKLKKYLFLISILFFVLTSFHLVYQYISHDAKMYPIKGGSVSEGIIGDFPSLNPLHPVSGNNGYFIELLYRSLLTYSTEESKIKADITSCDISNISTVKCFLQENIKWSNGDDITIQDIKATYELLQEYNINPVLSSLLEGTTITTTQDSITFEKAGNEDINFLNIFFQPILPSETINNIGKENLGGNFSTIGQIYSGKFKITNVQQDLSLGITKFILSKNEFYHNNPVLIDQLIIKLFPDTHTFHKNKETINIFQDNNNLIGSSLPRFDVNEYILPQHVSLFLNKETLPDIDFRNTILNKVSRENLIKHLGEENVVSIVNPYMTSLSIDKEVENKNYENIIAKYGYKKKSILIQEILPEQKPQSYYSEEITSSDLPENMSFDPFQTQSKTIVSPTYIEKYNSITKDNILLTGNADQNIDAIYINDYKLQGFKQGDKQFHYRINESYGNIQSGINRYKIYFENNGEKQLIEEIILIYHSDGAKLKRLEDELLEELYKNKIANERKEEQKESLQEPDLNKDKLKKLSELEDAYYYNNEYERLTLDLFYVATDKNIEKTAVFTKNSLSEIGIYVELHPVSISGLIKVLAKKDQYDIILAGINLGYFEYNIFPYFHSSQVKNGYNFSNIKKALLDNHLKELKEEIKNKEKRDVIIEKVLNILKDEQVVKTLYSPKQKLIIDKNIHVAPFPETLEVKSLRALVYNRLYTNEKKVISIEGKNIIGFFKYITNKLYE